MANTKEIQDRIKSINDTLKITNAMYMISSSKLKKSKKMLSDTEPYFFTLQSEMSRILRHIPDISSIYFKTNEDKDAADKKVGYIVITADKGLAGSYNHNVLKIAQEPVSLETPIGEEEDSHLGDFIPDDDAPAPAEAAAFTLLKEQLIDVLDTLTPREEKVLKLRFGLEDGRARTLEEVGKEFQVTRERIRQIEAKALRKLRHPSRSKKLRDFLE